MRVLRADPAILNPLQRRVLQLVGAAEQEYGPVQLRLMGGTALAAYYLGHRESEDLDFFGGPKHFFGTRRRPIPASPRWWSPTGSPADHTAI